MDTLHKTRLIDILCLISCKYEIRNFANKEIGRDECDEYDDVYSIEPNGDKLIIVLERED